MPSLNRLPLEIICSIARFVGSDYLRTHTDTLVLFKSWWQVARVVACEDLTLSIKTIDRYLEVPKSVQSLVQSSVKSLKIRVIEAEENHPEVSIIGEMISDHRNPSLSGVSQNIATREEWWIHVKKGLVRFASQLTHMHRLKSFSLVLFVYSEASQVQENASFTSIQTLLSSLPTTLSSLTIDHSGTPSKLAPGRQEGPNHLCSLLLNKSFTPRLRHLRIRSRNLCPKIFETISSEQYAQLESLVINLSLGQDDLPWISKVFYAHFCLGFQTNGKDLYSSLVDAAKATVPRLPCLKTLKMIRHNYPAEDLCSFDVLSDRCVILPGGIDWEAIDYVDDEQLGPECSDQSDDTFSGSESVDDSSWLDVRIERTL